MKIIGRIEKVANITSIVVESRAMAGRLQVYGEAFAEFADGQEVCIEINAPPVQRLARTYSPLFQPHNEPPLNEKRQQRIKAAVAEALDT